MKTKSIRPFQDLQFTDDFVFSHVLTSNPDLCKEITEAILDLKVKEIVHISKQPEVRPNRNGKGVRFDVYFEDDESVYEIEMQTSNQDNLKLRSRYYQSMIDRKILRRGNKYRELRKSYVIFICTFDLFGKSLGKYTFKNYCQENKDIELGDGAVKVFVNAFGDGSSLSDDMQDLMGFVATGKPKGRLSKKIYSEMEVVKMSPELEEDYMTFEQKMYEKYEEGRAEGRAEERQSNIKKMLKKMSVDDIVEMGFSFEDIKLAEES